MIIEYSKLKRENNKLRKNNRMLLDVLKEAKKEIIELTDSDRQANKVFYPSYIDKAIKKAEKYCKELQ